MYLVIASYVIVRLYWLLEAGGYVPTNIEHAKDYISRSVLYNVPSIPKSFPVSFT